MTSNNTPAQDDALLPKNCPFCDCKMRINSNRDWIHLVGKHGPDCIFEDDHEVSVSAEAGQLELLIKDWNTRAPTAPSDADRLAAWVNPHDKTQKQWLPWIKEKVIIKFNNGDIHEGWHTGGSWRVYAKPSKHFDNDEVELWAYPAALLAGKDD